MIAEGDLALSPADDGILAQFLTQHVERLAQRMTCLVLGGLGPEQTHQCFPAMKPAGLRGDQIRKEGYPLRLAEQGLQLSPISVAYVNRTEQTDGDHGLLQAAGHVGHHCDRGVTAVCRLCAAGELVSH